MRTAMSLTQVVRRSKNLYLTHVISYNLVLTHSAHYRQPRTTHVAASQTHSVWRAVPSARAGARVSMHPHGAGVQVRLPQSFALTGSHCRRHTERHCPSRPAPGENDIGRGGTPPKGSVHTRPHH